jgi:hypothetical protein
MSGMSTHRKRGKVDLYYRCPVTRGDTEYVGDCDLPLFRVDQVDAAVWDWVKSFLAIPEALTNGLRQYKDEQDLENEPIRERVRTVDGLLASHKGQLARLLDLYLSGDFPKEMLVDRKARLETTVSALENERAELVASLAAQTLMEEEIQGFVNFASEVTRGLEVVEQDFDTQRRIIEALDMHVTLTAEDGRRTVRVRCMLGKHSVEYRPILRLR